MAKAVITPRGTWRYTSGFWVRAPDGSMVSKCRSGRRKGSWKAVPLHGGQPIKTRPDTAGMTVWQGYGTAAKAMDAVDKYLDDSDRKIRSALGALTAPVEPQLADVRRLVIAARIVTDNGIYDDDTRELFDAVEAFSSRVPYDDGPSPAEPHPLDAKTIEAAEKVDEIAALYDPRIKQEADTHFLLVDVAAGICDLSAAPAVGEGK